MLYLFVFAAQRGAQHAQRAQRVYRAARLPSFLPSSRFCTSAGSIFDEAFVVYFAKASSLRSFISLYFLHFDIAASAAFLSPYSSPLSLLLMACYACCARRDESPDISCSRACASRYARCRARRLSFSHFAILLYFRLLMFFVVVVAAAFSSLSSHFSPFASDAFHYRFAPAMLLMSRAAADASFDSYCCLLRFLR